MLIIIPALFLWAGIVLSFAKTFNLHVEGNEIGLFVVITFGLIVLASVQAGYFPFSLPQDWARSACKEAIEEKSKYDYQWTDSWLEGKFYERATPSPPLTSADIPTSDLNFIKKAEKEGYSLQKIVQILNERSDRGYYRFLDVENIAGKDMKSIDYPEPSATGNGEPKYSIRTYTYTGDKIKLQNKFGAFSKYKYDCDYRTGIGSYGVVLEVRFTPLVNES